MFSVRVASTENRNPIWIKVQAFFEWHRLPADAKIMGVSLVRKSLPPHRMSDGKYHPRYQWSLQFTVRSDEVKPKAITGNCGIDLGWRLFEDGSLRIAYLVGDDGHREELRMPLSLVSRWHKSRAILSDRDKAFNRAIGDLIAWKNATVLPDWFVEACQFCHAWKAKGKLVALINRWHESRITGDESILASLVEWRDHDVHLWQYQVENERKAERIRKHMYLSFANRVAQRYGNIYVEDCDWRKLMRCLPPDCNVSDDAIKEYQRIASVGQRRECLKSWGAEMVAAENTTKECHNCHSIEVWDQAHELVHQCCLCDVIWDQDENAALNLVARGKVMEQSRRIARESQPMDSTGDSGIAQKYVGRWSRKKEAPRKRMQNP